jgi:hypothetical protein
VRILDIDLDFFLSGVSYGSTRGGRLEGERYSPWLGQEVRDFLESQCGLNIAEPLPDMFSSIHRQN